MTSGDATIGGFDLLHAPCGLFVFGDDLLLQAVNQTLADMLGTTRAALAGQSLDTLWAPPVRLVFHMQVLTLLHMHERVDEIALTMQAADGTEIPVLLNAVRRLREGLAVTECVVIRMHERKRLEDELFRVKKATEQVPGAIFQFLLRPDGTTAFPYASDGIRAVFECSPTQLQRDAALLFDRIHPADLVGVRLGIRVSARDMTPWFQQYRINLPKQGLRWLEGKSIPEARTDGSVLWHGYMVDITERKAFEAAAALQHERIRVTLRSIGDAVITTDQSGRVDYLNPVAESLTGWRCDEAMGQPVEDVVCIVHQGGRVPADNPVTRCLAEGVVLGATRDAVLIARNRHEYAVEDSAAPIFSADGTINGVVMVFRDVTQQRKRHRDVEYRATHDHLTGLINRLEFESALAARYAEVKAGGRSHALCLIDLDRFKAINDSCGHAAGDTLLRQVSQVLVGCVRNVDMVARLGGDEFGVLLNHCDLVAAQRVARTICERVAALLFVHVDQEFRIGASLGVVSVDARWSSAMQLQQAADKACFVAKAEGRNRVALGQYPSTSADCIS